MIDTHCHLAFDDLRPIVPEVLAECRDAGVWGLITVSTTTANALDNLAIAREHEGIWCTSGVHPLYAHEGPHDWEKMLEVARAPECVAFGELGLDDHHKEPPKAIQLETLAEQLEVIGRSGIDKPIVLHCRDAFGELIPILKESGLPGSRFVFHCFTAGPDEARLCLDFGAMISFTGVVTYRSARELHEAATLCPADRIMVETDAPFLSPEPHRGKWPCRPAWVRATAERLALLRGVDPVAFEDQLDTNACAFFGINRPC